MMAEKITAFTDANAACAFALADGVLGASRPKKPIIGVYSGRGKSAALLRFGAAKLLGIKHLKLSWFARRSTYRFSREILASCSRPFWHAMGLAGRSLLGGPQNLRIGGPQNVRSFATSHLSFCGRRPRSVDDCGRRLSHMGNWSNLSRRFDIISDGVGART